MVNFSRAKSVASFAQFHHKIHDEHFPADSVPPMHAGLWSRMCFLRLFKRLPGLRRHSTYNSGSHEMKRSALNEAEEHEKLAQMMSHANRSGFHRNRVRRPHATGS